MSAWKNSSTWRIAMASCMLIILAFSVPTSRALVKAVVHGADAAWFGERLQDAWGRFTVGEDWSRVPALRHLQDYTWLDAAGPSPVRIAHALGNSGDPDANSIVAMRRAAAEGIRLFEVDLSLEDGRELRCAHDPGTPRLAQACTFQSLM